MGQVDFIYSVERNWLNLFPIFPKLSIDYLKIDTSMGLCKMEPRGEGERSCAGLCVGKHAQ